MNDPLGSAANYLTQAFDNPMPPPYDKPVGSDDKGRYIAQLPHMVDLSIGYTIIGDQAKSSTSMHFAGKRHTSLKNKEFFDGWDKGAPVEDASKLDNVLNWFGI